MVFALLKKYWRRVALVIDILEVANLKRIGQVLELVMDSSCLILGSFQDFW